MLSRRLLAGLFAMLPLSLSASAQAEDTPCGTFDFSAGLSCEIQVEGGCKADCTPLKFEAGCSGGCTGSATTACVDDCGASCIAMCDPAHLDCFLGCHSECDQPTIAQCEQEKPGEDCVTLAQAQCDMHCNESCAVPPSDCQEHCNKCCTGSCTTQVNFSCDAQCFAELQGGCEVQCDAPSGAIFCNGQYVHASDIESCITYLATQGIEVDVSARGSLSCDLSGCSGEGDAAGCSAAPGPVGKGGIGLALVGLALGLVGERRRRSAQR